MKVVGAIALVFGACGDDLRLPDASVPPGEFVVANACVSQLHDAGANLVWLGCDGTIMTVVKASHRQLELATNETSANWLAADDRYAYWARTKPIGSGQIVRVPLVGGAPQILAAAQTEMWGDFPEQLVVDDTTVYRSMFSNILAMPKDGSAPQRVFAVGNSAPPLASDADYVYWMNLATIQRQRKDATTGVEVVYDAKSTLLEAPIAVTNAWLYFWGFGGLHRVVKTGGAPQTVDAQLYPTFAIDGDQLYAAYGNSIVRLGDDGTLAQVVACGAGPLALDEQYVYWAAYNSIYRAPK